MAFNILMYVLDGKEIADIKNLNPNDIVSMSILKDKSAAIYGKKGANGVVIVTTKRDKVKHP